MFALVHDGTVLGWWGGLPDSWPDPATGENISGIASLPVERQRELGWWAVTPVAQPAVGPSQTVDHAVVLVDGIPVDQWTVRARTVSELAADARGAQRAATSEAIIWLRQRALVYEQFGAVTTGNAVTALEALRQDQIIFMRGFADLLDLLGFEA